MTDLDLLNLARSATENQVTWFGQVITINFAMIVGIYYFLNRANLVLKILSFAAYSIGMLVYLGEMLIETNMKVVVLDALRALPAQKLSPAAMMYLSVTDSWLGLATRLVFNLSFWALWGGIIYLLFFWKKTEPEP